MNPLIDYTINKYFNMTHTSWHFVRCCDITTHKLLWVDPSTNCVLDTVQVSRYGRTSVTNG